MRKIDLRFSYDNSFANRPLEFSAESREPLAATAVTLTEHRALGKN